MPETQVALVFKKLGSSKRNRKLFDERQFRLDLRALNQATAKAMKRDFELTVKDWDEQPEFHQITEIEPYPTVIVYTEDETYGYVSGGTRVRRALMSSDFRSKTRPGVLRSRPGQGGVVFISKNLELPGIEAREFPKMVEKRRQKPHQVKVERALKRAVERANR